MVAGAYTSPLNVGSIGKFNDAPPAWWLPRSPEHLDSARYPATDSTFEWANEIMALDQLVVEGFQLKPLRKILEDKGAKAESNWGSLRVLGAILVAAGLTEDQAKATLTPLSRLHGLRSTLKAHSSVAENGVGVDPVSRTPHPQGERSPICQGGDVPKPVERGRMTAPHS
jgi:hypothetical protein